MSDYRRYPSHTACYFFTLVSYQRKPFFITSEFRKNLHDSLLKVRKVYPFEINAMVLLPDHLHCIWTLPREDTNYSRRWSMIKRYVTQQFAAELGTCAPYDEVDSVGCAMRTHSRIKRSESSLWQRRFWEHEIRNHIDFLKHLDYCYWNPLKHGLVARVVDWPYSTFHRDVKNGLYLEDWCGDGDDFVNMDFGE